ncbi:MAG: phosphatidate cytidylyltransferase [Anaerolineales bacterium]|nr:phosphatidate cytidylyltransferase [Anaerolineales bacterium]
MLLDRLAIVVPLIPLAVWVVYLGGPVYSVLVLALLAVAAREYARLFRAGGGRPARGLLVVGVPLIAGARWLPGLEPGWVLAAALVAALLWHQVDFERGAPASGTDFVITIGGLVYLGWMGGYFLALRALPDGLWWSAILFSGIWLADSAAFFAGRVFGRHHLAPRLSPKKTWEGYAGGVLGGGLGAALLALVWRLGAGPDSLINWPAGLALGALAGLIGPIGDLGISMLKRQTGVKDSGHVLAGHGGVLDRIDSWLIALPVGYFAVLLLTGWLR